MTEPVDAAPQNMAQPKAVPHIGAFVLETLTLGMYGEPRHTLREYVQNSFDAIRAARRTRFLDSRGRVDISIADDSIVIRDNGLGVRADQAWNTLTSIGASKKDRQRDAGFRGIGRLAGMAYCKNLIFRTTFPGETTLTVIDFDCQNLLSAMKPDEGGDVELAALLSKAIRFAPVADGAPSEDHFFEVELKGLEPAPKSLKDPAAVRKYLSEVVPVDFEPEWRWRDEIRSEYKTYFGEDLEIIDVFVTADGETTQIFKPYGDTYEHRKGTTSLQTVEFFPGEDNAYWGWVGKLSDFAAITDFSTRGVRVRVRNIQVDGTEIVEKLFTEVKPSFGRFNAYYIGEIHIDPEKVIPNARRDGFEETTQWIDIKNRISLFLCKPLADASYDASQQGQTNIGKVVDDIDKLVNRSTTLAESSRASYDQVIDLMNTAKRLRRRASSALKVVGYVDEAIVEEGDPEEQKTTSLEEAARAVETVETQARMMIGKFLDEDERLTGLKARLREEVLQELLDVVNLFVDPATYQKIRRQIFKAP
ncbi:ATP-binding protein [Rhizobium leguminosarum]|uniref:ATP-binding protein n=1 Tax=Rhizobium leguminosarum TaxID=384 RepID=UPI0014424C14|nr:ATP-binding protein [Rhizobium leguminosarum]